MKVETTLFTSNNSSYMFRLVCFLIVFHGTVPSLFGQNYLKEFGKIGLDEFELTQYADDPEAEAVVLFNRAKTYFAESSTGFDVIFECATRIKILAESGVDWAEVAIPYYYEDGIYEKVYDIEACAYNFEDGRLHKSTLNPNACYTEQVNDSWKNSKFAIPNAKKGSVIEYRYKIRSPYVFQLRDWDFQWRIPVVYSEYVIKMIPFYEYIYLLQGANTFDYKNSYIAKGLPKRFGPVEYQEMVHECIMKNIPAFKNEEFITSSSDYIMKLDLQLTKVTQTSGTTREILTSWDKMISDLLKHQNFGKYTKHSIKSANKLFNLDSIAALPEQDKFDFIVEYVKSNYQWNEENRKFASKPLKSFIKDKYGNSADINLFTSGLLNAVGIQAQPVISSTRNHGKIWVDYPFAHFFNYVLVLATVNGELVLTDATEPYNLNKRIPSRCINDEGLIIKENQVNWVKLACQYPSEIQTDLHIKLTPENQQYTTLVKTATEYDALNFRENYTDDPETIKHLISGDNHIIIDSTIRVQNQTNKHKPYQLIYDEIREVEQINNKIFIAPFLNETLSNNPLKQKQRNYPIDMVYPKRRVFNSSITIPEGYEIEYLPEVQEISNEYFDLRFTSYHSDDKIILSLGYYFKHSVYEPKHYAKIKYYFKQIAKYGNDKVVLRTLQTGSEQ